MDFLARILYSSALLLMLILTLESASAQDSSGGYHYYNHEMGGGDLYLHQDFTYRSYSYTCSSVYCDTGRWVMKADTLYTQSILSHDDQLRKRIKILKQTNPETDQFQVAIENNSNRSLTDLNIRIRGGKTLHVATLKPSDQTEWFLPATASNGLFEIIVQSDAIILSSPGLISFQVVPKLYSYRCDNLPSDQKWAIKNGLLYYLVDGSLYPEAFLQTNQLPLDFDQLMQNQESP